MMTRILSGSLMISLMILGLSTFAQDFSYINDPAFDFDRSDFRGEFSVYSHSEGSSDFYAVDLEKLPERFERVYFLNLVYREKMVISIDNDINKDILWFKSFDLYTTEDVLDLLKQLFNQTTTKSESLSGQEKNDWLKSHDKFSKR